MGLTEKGMVRFWSKIIVPDRTSNAIQVNTPTHTHGRVVHAPISCFTIKTPKRYGEINCVSQNRNYSRPGIPAHVRVSFTFRTDTFPWPYVVHVIFQYRSRIPKGFDIIY